MSTEPTEADLLRAQLACWKAIAASRERQNTFLGECLDITSEIAAYWRRKSLGEQIEFSEVLAKRIEELQSSA